MASEVLKVSLKAGLTNSESVLINGVNGHTYTILSISFCETAGAAETFDLYIDDGGGGTDFEILSDQALGANETFEYTGRIVLEDEDHLCAATAGSADVDVVVSYLDQTRQIMSGVIKDNLTRESGLIKAAGGGGKILQVVQNHDDQYASYSNTSPDAQATVLSQAITPSATSSKVLIQVNLCVSATENGLKHFGLVMYRGSTEIGSGDKSSWNSGVGETHSATEQVNYTQPDKILTGIFLDSPNTTSATTYNIKSFIFDFGSSITAKTLIVNGGGQNYNNKETAVTSSSITLMEVGA